MPVGAFSPSLLTVGLHVGDRTSELCLLDECGTVLETGRLGSTPTALARRFGTMPRVRIVLESGPPLAVDESPASGLWARGHRGQQPAARADRPEQCESDAVDAELLARLGRVDPALLAPVQHRGATAQADLAVLRTRNALVQARTMLVNHTRGSVKASGARVPTCSTASFAAGRGRGAARAQAGAGAGARRDRYAVAADPRV